MRPLRSLLSVAIATTVLGTLAACSSGSSGSTSSADGAPGSTTAATHTVKTAEGTVTVPSTPQRIVAIQPSALATLLNVGDANKVVGTYDEGASYVSPRYLATYNKVTKVGNEGQLNLEEIAALKPDLIIGANYTWNTQDYKELSAIAPTVIAPVTSWQATAQKRSVSVLRTDRHAQ
jgi:iron complex transport system substrate-binding protein